MIRCFAESTFDGYSLGFGSSVNEFERRFKSISKDEFNIATCSGSAAAFTIFSYLKKKYGTCDIYFPSLSFTSVCWSAYKNGHNIFFVDVDDNLLFDFQHYKELRDESWSKNPTVLMLLLYGGVSKFTNMDVYGDEIIVVDSAHSINPNIESDFKLFAFYPTKPICMSQGGIISTNSVEAEAYCKKFRNFGRVPSGDSYSIDEDGFKFYMDNLNAIIGLQSLDECRQNVAIRRQNFNILKQLRLPDTYWLEHDEGSSYYLATLILPEGFSAKNFRYFSKLEKLETTFHYPFLHKQPFYIDRCDIDKYPNLDALEDRIVNVPINEDLVLDDMVEIIDILRRIYYEHFDNS
jgi:dTDP-4-amino-4,6-dideoxygalactose transaminase